MRSGRRPATRPRRHSHNRGPRGPHSGGAVGVALAAALISKRWSSRRGTTPEPRRRGRVRRGGAGRRPSRRHGPPPRTGRGSRGVAVQRAHLGGGERHAGAVQDAEDVVGHGDGAVLGDRDLDLGEADAAAGDAVLVADDLGGSPANSISGGVGRRRAGREPLVQVVQPGVVERGHGDVVDAGRHRQRRAEVRSYFGALSSIDCWDTWQVPAASQ